MKPFLLKLPGRAADLAQTQPLLALFLGAALLAVFFEVVLRRPGQSVALPSSLIWIIYDHARRLVWAVTLVLLLASVMGLLRTYLRQTVGTFQRSHGRVTEANYNAVQTIWGAEQEQGSLRVDLYWEEEVTERIESEDLTKPAVLRKKTVRHQVTANPFLTERHEVTLKQNPRKKGSALYGGYETACRFSWKLRNPAERAVKANIKFPLPAATGMYDDLGATWNGVDVLPQMELKESGLTLIRELQAGEAFALGIAFKSRGMSHWYFQVREPREIRDFTLALNLPDLPKSKLNYPEGCMSPTEIRANGPGSALIYRLDHAISHKGMGIALPALPQPGAATNAVLGETERGWMLNFALLLLAFTLLEVRHGGLLAALFGAGIAFIYGLLGDFSDLLFGFWGTAVLVVTPLLLGLAASLRRFTPAGQQRQLTLQFLAYGLLYPTLAGLDVERQSLYLNVCALGLLAYVAWLAVRRWSSAPVSPTDA